jgi:hypothetical protein
MLKILVPAVAVFIGAVTAAAAAGGGGAAAAGSGGAAHGGSSFGKPAVGNNPFPGVTARPGCLGGTTGASSTGAPSPMALPSQISPSPTNGSAVRGTLQSTPDVPRLTREDQQIIGQIKQANDRLGQVGNPRSDHQPGSPSASSGGAIQPPEPIPSRPMPPPSQANPSAAKSSTDRGMAQGKPDVARMSEEDQRLAREIIGETEKLGKIGNPGGSGAKPPLQGTAPTNPSGDVHRDTNGPHLPTNTLGAASGSAC